MARIYKLHNRPNRQTIERVLVFGEPQLVLARIRFEMLDKLCECMDSTSRSLALKALLKKIATVKDLIELLYSTVISEFQEAEFLTWIIPDTKENSRKLKSMNRKCMTEVDRALAFMAKQFQGGRV